MIKANEKQKSLIEEISLNLYDNKFYLSMKSLIADIIYETSYNPDKYEDCMEISAKIILNLFR